MDDYFDGRCFCGKVRYRMRGRPMFIHCTAAIRVGAFWLIRRVVRDGWTWDRALEDARKVGLSNAPHLEDFARQYIASHGSTPPTR